MRIGIVVPVFPEKITSNELGLAEGLSRRGHDVCIITSARAGSRLRSPSLLIHSADSRTDKNRPFSVIRLRTIPTLYDEASIPLGLGEALSQDFDVLLLQEDYPPICLFAALIARRKRTPFFLSFERYCYYGKGPAIAIGRIQDLSINRVLWKKADGLTFHSRAAASFLSSIGAPSGRMFYTPAPVNCDLFSPVPVHQVAANCTSIRILCVARLVQAKGLDVLLEATKLLAAEEGLDFSVVIRGRGPLAGFLQQRVRELNLASIVHIDQSMAPPAQHPRIYRGADIYVQPSLHEPFGLACREAMATGLPVVGSRTGGLVDAVIDGMTGFLVPPGDARGLASAIGSLVRSESRRSELGRMARRKAVEEFDLGVVAAKYERIILGLRTEQDRIALP